MKFTYTGGKDQKVRSSCILKLNIKYERGKSDEKDHSARVASTYALATLKWRAVQASQGRVAVKARWQQGRVGQAVIM